MSTGDDVAPRPEAGNVGVVADGLVGDVAANLLRGVHESLAPARAVARRVIHFRKAAHLFVDVVAGFLVILRVARAPVVAVPIHAVGVHAQVLGVNESADDRAVRLGLRRGVAVLLAPLAHFLEGRGEEGG